MYKTSVVFRPTNHATRTIMEEFTETDFTSVTATNSTSKITLGGGNPVTEGLKVGDEITFANLSVAGNNTAFVITAFGGTSNRELTVSPAPTDMTADTAFTMTVTSLTFDAVSEGINTVRLSLAGSSSPAFYQLGTNPVAANNDGVMLAEGAYEYIALHPGEKIAVSGTDGTINFAEADK